MRIFISGETDERTGDNYRIIRNDIESKLKILEHNDYGNEFAFLGIAPIIIDPRRGLFEAGFFKERKLIKRKSHEADIRLRTDFDKFVLADNDKKRLLLLDNIIRSIKVIGEKSKTDFNSEKLINDIYKLFDISEDTLRDL